MHKDTKELENRNKKWLGRGAFLFVIFHFVTLLITIFPTSFTSEKAQRISNYYVSPLFSQSWSMFAPCPLTDNYLEYKLYFDGDSTELIKPSETNFKFHSVLRLTHHGDLAVGEYNLLYWIKLELDQLRIKPNQTLNDDELQKFKQSDGSFYLKNYLNGASLNTIGEKADSSTFILNYYNVKTNETNSYTLKHIK